PLLVRLLRQRIHQRLVRVDQHCELLLHCPSRRVVHNTSTSAPSIKTEPAATPPASHAAQRRPTPTPSGDDSTVTVRSTVPSSRSTSTTWPPPSVTHAVLLSSAIDTPRGESSAMRSVTCFDITSATMRWLPMPSTIATREPSGDAASRYGN